MDKASKKLLKLLNQPQNKGNNFNYTYGINNIVTALESDRYDVLKNVLYLAEQDYIMLNGLPEHQGSTFCLSHKGIHWKEFRRKEILKYIADKWIDFFALAVAIAALVLSIIALQSAQGWMPQDL